MSVRRWGERLGESYLSVSEDAQVRGRAIPPAVIESGASVAEGAHVGSLVVLGHDVTVGAGEHGSSAARDPQRHRDRRELHATRLHRGRRVCRIGAGTHIEEGRRARGGGSPWGRTT